MAMPQRDNTIEAIKRLDALLEYAVMHGDEEEAERIREKLRELTDEAWQKRKNNSTAQGILHEQA